MNGRISVRVINQFQSFFFGFESPATRQRSAARGKSGGILIDDSMRTEAPVSYAYACVWV
jgi:hypothetical protein